MYYDEAKPALMKKFILFEMKLQQEETFTKSQFIDAFRKKYSRFKESGIVRSLCRLSINDTNREMYKPREGDDFLWKIDGHTYRLYNKTTDTIVRRPQAREQNGS